MADPKFGLPVKVADIALAAGAHVDCLTAGHSGACDPCRRIMNQAFDVVYGHIEKPVDVLATILSDLGMGR